MKLPNNMGKLLAKFVRVPCKCVHNSGLHYVDLTCLTKDDVDVYGCYECDTNLLLRMDGKIYILGEKATYG